MFNRAEFNKTPFNRFELAFRWSGTGEVVCEASGACHVYRSMSAAGEIISNISAVNHIFRSMSGVVDITCEAAGHYVRVRYFEGAADVICSALPGTLYKYALESFDIDSLDMAIGDQLIIDMDKMIVTLNGVNVGAKVTDDAVFFKLKPGENELTFKGENSAQIKIEYRDRWL